MKFWYYCDRCYENFELFSVKAGGLDWPSETVGEVGARWAGQATLALVFLKMPASVRGRKEPIT